MIINSFHSIQATHVREKRCFLRNVVTQTIKKPSDTHVRLVMCLYVVPDLSIAFLVAFHQYIHRYVHYFRKGTYSNAMYWIHHSQFVLPPVEAVLVVSYMKMHIVQNNIIALENSHQGLMLGCTKAFLTSLLLYENETRNRLTQT